MTDQDRIKWDARYKSDPGNATASSVVTGYWHLASRGKALDIACGNGRNSLFLANQGFSVDAVDISTTATSRLKDRHRGIQVICQDLDTYTITKDRYDLILDIRFLDRRLFSMMLEGLKPGGVLIVESFIGPQDDPYCLRENELLRAFQPLRVVYYEEKESDQSARFGQIAALVAVKP